MSKTKKIISLILALALMVSAVPYTAFTASAVTAPVWTQSSIADSMVGATVTATEVIRVAFDRNSFLNGNKIVAATPSGIPWTSGNYSGSAYAGESVVTPKITLTLTKAPTATPELTISSLTGQEVSIDCGSANPSGTTYTWTIPTDGTQIATAGDTLLYTFNYQIGDTPFVSYGVSNVQNITSAPGSALDYHYDKLKIWTVNNYHSRFNVLMRVLGNGVYGRIEYKDSVNSNHNAVNWTVNPSTNVGTSVGTDFFINEQAPNAENKNVTASVYTYLGNSGTDQYRQAGYAADHNRPHADIFIDRSRSSALNSTGANAINMRYSVDVIGAKASVESADDCYADILYVCDRILSSTASTAASGSTANLGSSNDVSSYIDMPFGSGYQTNAMYIGNYIRQNFTGTGFFDNTLSTGTAKTIAFCYEIYGNCTYGKFSDSQNYIGSSMYLNFYNVDKGDLRNLFYMCQNGTSFRTSRTYSYTNSAGTTVSVGSGETITSTEKGYNPQYAYYTQESVSAFMGAYAAAATELFNGKSTDQNAVNTAFANLLKAYRELEFIQATTTAHFYLNGTTTPVSSELADSTITTTAGVQVTCTAPNDVPGYKLVSNQTQSTSNIDGASITFYYVPDSYTYTFNPVEIDAGNSKTRDFTYGSQVNAADIPEFTILYKAIEGWYENYDASTGTYSNPVTFPLTVGVGAKTMYAKWTWAPKYVYYDLSSANATMPRTEYDVYESTVRPADPVVPGYGFIGWYTDATFVTEFTWGTQFQIDSPDLTAYAKFESYDGKLIFNENGGSEVTDIVIADAGYTVGSTVTLPQPTRAGYTFNGWYLNAELTNLAGNASMVLNANTAAGCMLYAKWTPKAMTIHFDIEYDEYSAAPIDTTVNPESISGYAGDSIPGTVAASGGQYVMPADPVKYGYVFKGWTRASKSQYFANENAFNNAAAGYLYEVENGIFPELDVTEVTLKPIWVKYDYSAYIEVDAYKDLYGQMTPVEETTVSEGDIITVRMKSTTNFYTGSSLFVYMYDKDFFTLVGEGSDAFTVNTENSYISAIGGENVDVTGYTASTAAQWPADISNNYSSDYNWIQVAIDPDVAGGNLTPGAMNDGTWVVEFKLKVNANAPGSTGDIFMDNAWTRTEENNDGTMFYGWCQNATTNVWNSYNNRVTPVLDLATATVTYADVEDAESTINLQVGGYTTVSGETVEAKWPDGSTGTKSYTGDCGEEIMDPAFVAPTLEGHTLVNWLTADGSDEWVAGYYGSSEQNGKTFIAQWDADTYKVTFDSNAGKFADGTTAKRVDYDYGTLVSACSETPVYTGYALAGWALTPDATVDDIVDFSTVVMGAEDVTYYAVWEYATDTQFKITVIYTNKNTGNLATAEFDKDDGYYGTTYATVHVVADDTGLTDTDTDIYLSYAELPSVGAGRYHFDPSNSSNVLECEIKADGTGNLVLYYRANVYTAVFDLDGGTFTSYSVAEDINEYGVGFSYTANADGNYESYVEYRDSYVPPVDATKDGYTFLGWGTVKGGTTAVSNFTANNNNVTYYAQWQPATVPVEFNPNGGLWSDGTNAAVTKNIVFGRTITAPGTPTRAGFEFKGWALSANAGVSDVVTLGTLNTTTPDPYFAVWAPAEQTYNVNIYYMDTTGAYPTTASATDTGKGFTNSTATYTPAGVTGFTVDSGKSVLTGNLTEQTASAPLTLSVYYTRNQFTLTFAHGYETTEADTVVENVYYEADISALAPTYTRTGYTQNGWKEGTPSTMPNSDKTFTADWTVNSYDLTFMVDWKDGKGYVEYGTTTKVDFGTNITAPGNPSVTGYTFTGWAETANATSALDSLGTMPANAYTLYSVFTVNSYDAVFIVDGTEYDRVPTNYGEAIEAPANPGKLGYTFGSWTPSVPATMPAQEMTFTAVFNPIPYPATFDPNGGAWSDGSTTAQSSDVDYDSNFNAPSTPPAKAGYNFDGWYLSTDANTLYPSGAQLKMDTINGETYLAKWSAKTNMDYTVSIYRMDTTGNYPANATSSSVYTDGVTDAEKDVTSLVTVPTGFIIDEGKSELVKVIDADTANNVFNVYLKRNTYTLYIDNDGTVTSDTVYYGATVTNPADVSKTGYSFNGWKWYDAADAEISKPATMPAGNIKAVAQFSINTYTLTFQGEGIDTQTITDEYGKAFTVPTVTRTGYTFKNWDKEVPATIPAENTTFTAVWEADEHTVTFNPNGGVAGAVSTKQVAYDSAITADGITEPTRDGYSFIGWAKTATATAAEDLGIMDVTDDTSKVVYAVWEANTVDFFVEIYYMTTEGTYNTDPDATETLQGTVDTKVEEVPETKELVNGALEKYKKDGFVTPQIGEFTGTIPATGSLVLKAYYIRNQYTVNFHPNTGKFVDTGAAAARTETFYYDEVIAAPAVERTGYTFTGWNPALPEKMPADNIAMARAQWKANDYTVTFDANGGEYAADAVTSKKVAYASAITADGITEPTRTGYTFLGWSLTSGANNAVSSSLGNMDVANDTDKVIYAVWKINTYTVVFDANGGAYADDATVKTADYDYGTSYDKYVEDPEQTGYVFAGWGKTADATEAVAFPVTMGTTGVTYYAIWTPDEREYTVEYYYMDVNGAYGETADEVAGPFDTETDAIVNGEHPDKTGMTYDAAKSDKDVVVPAEGDVVVKIYYTRNQYDLTFVNGYDATDDTTISDVYFEADITSKVPTFTREGYTFTGWEEGTPSTMPAGDANYTATWGINKYTITYKVDGAQYGDVDSLNYNDTVTERDEPSREGYTFSGWTWSTADGKAPATMPATNLTVEGVYTINTYTMTYMVDYADGKGFVNYKGIPYEFNADTSAEAEPTQTGYTFSGWKTTEACDTAYTFGKMPSGNVTVYGKFTVNTYNVSYEVDWADGNGSVAYGDGDSFNYGEAVTIETEPTKTGYTFSGWSWVKVEDGSSIAAPATMPEYDIKATGSFTADDKVYYVDIFEMKTDGTYPDAPARTIEFDSVTDAEVSYTPDAAATGFELDSDNSTLEGTVPATGSLRLTVKYARSVYTIKTVVDGKETSSTEYRYGAVINAISDPEKEGHSFGGWTWTKDDGSATTAPATMPAFNVTATANWDIISYTLTYEVATLNADGTLGVATIVKTETVPYNSELTQYAPENPEIANYTFTGWDYSGNTTMPANDLAVKATFVQVEVTLEIAPNSTTVIDDVTNPTAEFTGYIYGLKTKLSKTAFENDYVQVIGDGVLKTTVTQYNVCGTGAKVELFDRVANAGIPEDEWVAKETYYIVIYGDVNGDSNISALDATAISNEIGRVTSWSRDEAGNVINPDEVPAYQYLAANLDGYDVITTADSTIIREIVHRYAAVDQATKAVTRYYA